MNISAKLVADGVGLPDVWSDIRGWLFDSREEIDQLHEYDVDLTHPQTAFGVALKLDEWEAAADQEWCSDQAWAVVLAEMLADRNDPAKFLATMAARLTHIGHDHAIRRALGEEPKPGTLMTLEHHKGRWVMILLNDRVFAQTRIGDRMSAITDPIEALAAIHAEVCNNAKPREPT